MRHSIESIRPAPGYAAESGVAQYRRALAKFPTGVTVVTACRADGRPVGLTVSSFVSISLEPAIIAWSLRLSSSLHGEFAAASKFAVNVLAQHQGALAAQFAVRSEDRFAGIDWVPGIEGCPVLTGAAAVFECSVVSSQIVGDHRVFLGGVLKFAGADLEPLVTYSGKVVPAENIAGREPITTPLSCSAPDLRPRDVLANRIN